MAVVRQKISKKGFTLIELLVTVVVLSIVIFIGVDLFVNILKNNNKATITNEVRQNGQLVMAILERNIRESIEVSPIGQTKKLTLTKSNGANVEIECVDPTATENGKITLNGVSITNENKDSGVNVVGSCMMEAISTPPTPIIIVGRFEFEQSKFSPTRKDFVANISFNPTFSLRSKTE